MMISDLIKIIRSQIQNDDSFTEKVDDEIEALAQKHDVAQFYYAWNRDNKKLSEIVARMMRLSYNEEEMMSILEEAKIEHVPLKGTVLRTLYPQFWMRTSCDIDILIHEEDIDQAIEAFKVHGYRVADRKDYHEISVFSPDGNHLELHFSIRETKAKMDRVLDQVWNYVILQDGYHYRYVESKEFFLFHHIAHMAYHFEGGGCGIRPFIDLWLIMKSYDIEETTYRKLLCDAELDVFEKNAMALMHYWFDDAGADELVLDMERYIICGGVYGSDKQSLIIKREKGGGKIGYFLKRMFMPYEKMTILYPVLKKYKFLLPIYEIHRWFKVILIKDRITNEVQTILKVDDDYSIEMMRKLGL